MKKLALVVATVFLIAPVPNGFATDSLAGPSTFKKLETLSYQEVCGLDIAGKTICLSGGGETTWIPEAVGRLDSVFSNDSISCGNDEVGLKCWKLPSVSPKIESAPQPQAFRNFFRDAEKSSVRLGTYSACGVKSATHELECLVPDWNNPSSHLFRVAPKTAVLAIAIDDSLICWADGTSAMSEIKCRKDARTTSWPSAMTFADLSELAVGPNWVCARSKAEAKCWNSRTAGSVNLPTELVTAKQWAAASDGLCALTQDSRIVLAVA